jgi:hypothetical protein
MTINSPECGLMETIPRIIIFHQEIYEMVKIKVMRKLEGSCLIIVQLLSMVYYNLI